MNSQLIAPLIHLCQNGNEQCTGIDLGPTLSVYPTRTNQLQTETSLLFKNGTVRELACQGFIRHEGRLIMLIEQQACLSTLALYKSDDVIEASKRILEIAETLASYPNIDQLFHRGMVLSSIILVENSGFIILRAKVADFQRSLLTSEDKFNYVDSFHNPALQGQSQLSFALAIKLYQVLFGQLPYSDSKVDYIHNMIRGDGLASAAFISLENIELQNRFDALIEARLKDYTFLDLSLYIKEIIKQLSLGLSLKKDVLNEATNPWVKRYKSRQKSIKIKSIFSEKKSLFAVLAVLFIFVATTLWTMISPNFRTPLTIGLDATELVYSYYKAFDAFDGDFIRDALSDKEEAKINDYITSLFVLERLRIVSDGLDTRMNIDRWLELNKPLLHSKIVLFGSHNVSITRERILNDGLYEFEVQYDFYNNLNQNSAPETLELSPVSIERRKEVLILKKIDETRWEIDSIERLEVELLE